MMRRLQRPAATRECCCASSICLGSDALRRRGPARLDASANVERLTASVSFKATPAWRRRVDNVRRACSPCAEVRGAAPSLSPSVCRSLPPSCPPSVCLLYSLAPVPSSGLPGFPTGWSAPACLAAAPCGAGPAPVAAAAARPHHQHLGVRHNIPVVLLLKMPGVTPRSSRRRRHAVQAAPVTVTARSPSGAAARADVPLPPRGGGRRRGGRDGCVFGGAVRPPGADSGAGAAHDHAGCTCGHDVWVAGRDGRMDGRRWVSCPDQFPVPVSLSRRDSPLSVRSRQQGLPSG